MNSLYKSQFLILSSVFLAKALRVSSLFSTFLARTMLVLKVLDTTFTRSLHLLVLLHTTLFTANSDPLFTQGLLPLVKTTVLVVQVSLDLGQPLNSLVVIFLQCMTTVSLLPSIIVTEIHLSKDPFRICPPPIFESTGDWFLGSIALTLSKLTDPNIPTIRFVAVQTFSRHAMFSPKFPL